MKLDKEPHTFKPSKQTIFLKYRYSIEEQRFRLFHHAY